YLLQIVAEHEAKGENVLPINVLTDLVRSYTTEMGSVVPQFLAASFEMLREGQSKMLENLSVLPNPMAAMPGFDAMRKQQEVFMKTFMGGLPGWGTSGPAPEAGTEAEAASKDDELAQIKRQLAVLQKKLAKL
ncbi:MAG: polyhydroxyalkanoate synthesis repressor PhaR, partial [Pseudomonadota bacterium]